MKVVEKTVVAKAPVERRAVTSGSTYTLVHLFTNKVFSRVPQTVTTEDDNDWFKAQVAQGKVEYVGK